MNSEGQPSFLLEHFKALQHIRTTDYPYIQRVQGTVHVLYNIYVRRIHSTGQNTKTVVQKALQIFAPGVTCRIIL